MQIGTIGNSGYEHANRVYKGGCCPVLQSRDFKDPIKVIKKMSKYNTNPSNIYIYILGEMDNSDGSFESANRVYGGCGLAPTIPTACGGGHIPKIARKKNVDENKTVEDYLITAKDGEQYGTFKLSPRECLRLMNVRDTDIDKMQAVNSNTQCYKQAGNSIVVSVLVGIFSQLGIQNCKKWNDMTDEERYEIIKPGE